MAQNPALHVITTTPSPLYPVYTTQNNRDSTVQYGSGQLLICCLNANRTELNRTSLTVLEPPNVAVL